jgi:Tfp pilus assembly protein PilF/GR25 family glycosyltransferase involved in LPS biosynthesis
MRAVVEMYQQALAALRAGNPTGAEQRLRAILRIQPDHLGALNLLTAALVQLSRYEEAERFALLALQTTATSDVTFYNYGIILKALKRPSEALQQFSRALAINSNVAESWNNRGAVLNELRRHVEALGDFDRAISINPSYAHAFFNKGNTLMALGEQEEALAAYNRAAALEPNFTEAWLCRSRALIEQNLRGDSQIPFVAREHRVQRVSHSIPFLVLHYKPAMERRTYIENEWNKQSGRNNFDIEFVTQHDRDEPHVEASYTYDERKYRESVTDIKDIQVGYWLALHHHRELSFSSCVDLHKSKRTSLDQDFDDYLWLNEGPLSPGDVSLILKHREAWKNIAEGASDWAIIAEDDIIFYPQSLSYLSHLVSDPPKNADYIDIAAGQGFRPRIGNRCINDHFFEMDPPKTRTTCAAIVSRLFAQRLIGLNSPICLGIDWMLNWAFGQLGAKVYWVEPTAFAHGSQINVYPSFRETEDLNSRLSSLP